MKIGVVQIKPIAGNLDANIKRHVELVKAAIEAEANLIYFPELSVTGYEPCLSRAMATSESDKRFNIFQEISDTYGVTIGIGVPLIENNHTLIGMVWFQANQTRTSYSKQILHFDETSIFVSGNKQLILEKEGYCVAPAICYESLQPEHSIQAINLGANIYLASVAKSSEGIEKAMQYFPELARKKGIFITMANCIGPCEDFFSVGNSAVWGTDGSLLGQLGSETEGIIIVDVETSNTVTQKI